MTSQATSSVASRPKRARFDKWVGWTLRQAQAERQALQHRHMLYGGAAGGGKSYWLRWGLVRDLMRWFHRYGLKGVRVGLFCETFTALHDRQIIYLLREVPEWLGVYKAQPHELHLRAEYGGGIVALRNLDDESKYLSAEFAGLAFDELTRNKEGVYDFLNSRLRWPGLPDEEHRSRCGTNPGGIGHAWVKRRWIDREFYDYEKPGDYAFTQAFAKDNPHLPAGYVESLKALPENLRQAYLEGRWDLFAGQAFPEWRADVHVVQPQEFPADWLRFRALDYGYTAPSAVGWYVCDPSGADIYLYRELYEAGLGPAQLAEAIRNLTPATEEIKYTVADPSLFKVNEQSGASNADVMAKNGVACMAGINDRLSGWRVMHEYLRPYEVKKEGGGLEKRAHFKVASMCRNFIRTFPAVVLSETRPEDVDTDCEDHMADMARYGLMSRPALELHPAAPDAERVWERKWGREFPDDKATVPAGRQMGW